MSPSPKKPPASSALAARLASGRTAPVPAVESEAPASAGGGLPHRLTLDLDGARYAALRDAAYRLHVPASAILRALLTAWLEAPDSPTAVRAAELAQLETEALRRRKGSGNSG